MAKPKNTTQQSTTPNTAADEVPIMSTSRLREHKPRERRFVVKGKGFRESFDAQWKAETFLAGLTDERLPATIDHPDGGLHAFRQASDVKPPPVDQTVAPRDE